MKRRRGRTIALSWGSYGGFYMCRWRICLGWVALTFVWVDFDAMLRRFVKDGDR